MEPLERSRSLVVWRKFYIKPRKTKPQRTICECIREIYRDAEARGDVLTMERCGEAHDMAKRMHKRLKWYWQTYKPEK